MALSTQVGVIFTAHDRSAAGMASFQRQIGSVTNSVLRLIGLGTGLYAFERIFTDTINRTSHAMEVASMFNVVFRDQASATAQWAEDFGNKVGRSTNDLKEWLAGLQDTFVPLGFARDKAAELSKELVKLAVDVGSFKNVRSAEAIRDFTSALVGNHEAVRKYGIIITEASLKQEALKQGITKNYNELTNLEKVSLRYAIIQASTTDAQGDAIRTADSYANQVERIKANYDELATTLGEQVVPALADLLKHINNFAEHGNLKAVIHENIAVMYEFADALTNLDEIFVKINPKKWPATYKEMAAEHRKLAAEARAIKPEPTDITGNAPNRPDISPPPAEILTKEQLAADKRMDMLRRQVAEEIALTGRLNEPRQHAKMMIEYQAEAAARYGEKTREAKAATDAFADSLKQLERAESLARIAEDIGQAFSTAFEDAILEAKNLNDVLDVLARSIQRAFFQEMVSKPLANIFTQFAGNMMGAKTAHSGGRVGSLGSGRWVDSSIFDNAPKFHDLRPGETAIIAQDDEVISRPGRRLSGGGSTVNLTFQVQTIDSRGVDQFLNQNRRQIASAVKSALDDNGPGRR